MNFTPYPLGIRPDGQYQVVDYERTLSFLIRFWWFLEPANHAKAEAEATLLRWMRLGLPCRRVAGRLLFDPYQVINFGVDAHLKGIDDTFATRAVTCCRRALEMVVAGGTVATYNFHFRREFGPHRASRLRAPLPLAAPLGSIEWFLPPHGGQAYPGRVEVRVDSSREEDVLDYRGIFAVERNNECDAIPILVPEERVLYTNPIEGLIRVTPAVSNLAADISTGAGTDSEVLKYLWRYFFQKMKVGFVHPDELNPADPMIALLGSGWCDCRTGAALLISLCRARGIPARLVNGYTLAPGVGDDHYWAEVFIHGEGWRPIDVSGWQLAAGQTDDPDWTDRLFGWIEPRLVMQRFPRQVMGRPAGPFPASYYRLVSLCEGGTESTFRDLHNDRLLYRDRFSIQQHCETHRRVTQ